MNKTLYLMDDNFKLYYCFEGSEKQINKMCEKIRANGGNYYKNKNPYLHDSTLYDALQVDEKPILIIRVENCLEFYEYNKPILIWPDGNYCACTGHGQGDLSALIEQTREITLKELNALNGCLYGYNLKDFNLLATI